MATAVDLVGVHGTRNAAPATPELATPGLAACGHAPDDKLATRVAGRIEAEIVRRGCARPVSPSALKWNSVSTTG